tara:strand:+ start:1326 stop:1544 length:219 start_codon:yes stop_codon:yes gene_type:complete
VLVAATLLYLSSYPKDSTFFILTQAPSTREKTCDIGSLVSVSALLKIPLIGTTAAAGGLTGLVKERTRFNHD